MRIDDIFMLALMAVALLACIGSSVLVFLFKHRSEETKARIVRIEQKRKSYDSTRDRWIAYDYVYEYVDWRGQKQTGILYRNTPSIEFSVGDEIPVKYLQANTKLVIDDSWLWMLSIVPYMTFLMVVVFTLIWIF